MRSIPPEIKKIARFRLKKLLWKYHQKITPIAIRKEMVIYEFLSYSEGIDPIPDIPATTIQTETTLSGYGHPINKELESLSFQIDGNRIFEMLKNDKELRLAVLSRKDKK